jgi:hypothetical protein
VYTCDSQHNQRTFQPKFVGRVSGFIFIGGISNVSLLSNPQLKGHNMNNDLKAIMARRRQLADVEAAAAAATTSGGSNSAGDK